MMVILLVGVKLPRAAIVRVLLVEDKLNLSLHQGRTLGFSDTDTTEVPVINQEQ